jgi:hypothetical protein
MDLDNSFVRKILFVAIFFTLFASFGAGQSVRAQGQAAIKITARAGFRGSCKPDKWLPVHITVENTGTDVEARIQAAYKNSASGQTVSAMDVSLPATSRKEFFLYIMPEGFMRNFTVSVLDGDKSLAKTNLNISCSDDTVALFGIMADTPSNFSVLNNIRPLTGTARTVQLDIPDLPDQAQGWEMLDALVVSNIDTGTLSAGQKQALELWLAGGGKLFVTGGIQWQSTTVGLDDLLPVQPSSTRKVSTLTALSAYAMDSKNPLESEVILATGGLQTGATILVEQDGIPLLAEKEIGFGKTYYFAADPGLIPLSDWEGMESIYQHLLGFKSPKPTWTYGVRDTYYASTALSTLPELSLPSFLYICGWLGLYIVVIGPVNYFVLRRIAPRRTEFAWVTIPVLVVIFTSLAYFSGYAYRGTKPILNRIMMMQGWQGMDEAQVNALVGVYSPIRTTYDLEAQQGFLISPFPSINESMQGGGDWLSIKSNDEMTLPGVRVEIGGMKSLGADGYLPAPDIEQSLTITFSDNTPVLSGTIANTNGYILEDAVIVTPSGWETLGDINPGESKKIKFTLINNSSAANMNNYNLINLLGWDPYLNEDIVSRRRSSFFQSISNTYGSINVNSGFYLMGWTDDKFSAPVTLQGEDPGVTDSVLYFRKLDPEIATEFGDLMLTSSIYEWESSLGDALITSSYNLGSDGYSIRFQPSLPVEFSSVDNLNLTIGSNSGPIPTLLNAAIWNYQTGAWQPLALDTYGNVEVPEPEQCVGMDGEIFMNIQGDPNAYFDITSIDFTLRVQP